MKSKRKRTPARDAEVNRLCAYIGRIMGLPASRVHQKVVSAAARKCKRPLEEARDYFHLLKDTPPRKLANLMSEANDGFFNGVSYEEILEQTKAIHRAMNHTKYRDADDVLAREGTKQ